MSARGQQPAPSQAARPPPVIGAADLGYVTRMSASSRALLVGVGAFVIGLMICVAIFAALDVSVLFLPGPAIGVGIAAYSAYRTSLHDAG